MARKPINLPVPTPEQLPHKEQEEKVVKETPSLTAPVCDNCAYWLRVAEKDYGRCRRFPPFLSDPSHLTVLGPVVKFGLTMSDTVCGEHPRFHPSR